MGKSSPSTPAVPNYQKIARNQAAENERANQVATFANRPSTITPFGSNTWNWNKTRDPVTGKKVLQWTQESALNPELQGALEAQQGFQRDTSELAGGMFGSIADAYGQPFDTSGARGIADIQDPLEYRTRAEDAVYDRFTSRLDNRFGENEEALQSRLYNQGLRPGDEAYDAEMRRFEEGRTDAYQAAMNEAVGAGRDESQTLYGQQLMNQRQSAQLREQEIAEQLRNRNLPLAEAQALLSGQGVSPVTGGAFTPTAGARPADYMGAAQQGYQGSVDAYNAQQAQRQGRYSGLAGLAKLGISAAGSIFGP